MSDESPNKKPSNFDLYKIALETRNFEIELSWKRSNYFLVLNTAIAVGFFWLDAQQSEDYYLYNDTSEKIYKLMIAIGGLIISLLWANVNFGSKYWQSYWEERLLNIEKELNITDKTIHVNFFTTNRGIINDAVRNNLGAIDRKVDKVNLEFKQKRTIKNTIYKYGVLRNKPSVSYMMILLSLLFTLFWSILFFNWLFYYCEPMTVVAISIPSVILIPTFLFCDPESKSFWILSIVSFAIIVICILLIHYPAMLGFLKKLLMSYCKIISLFT